MGFIGLILTYFVVVIYFYDGHNGQTMEKQIPTEIFQKPKNDSGQDCLNWTSSIGEYIYYKLFSFGENKLQIK